MKSGWLRNLKSGWLRNFKLSLHLFFSLHSHDFRAPTLSKFFQVPSCHVISHFVSHYWLLVFSNYQPEEYYYTSIFCAVVTSLLVRWENCNGFLFLTSVDVAYLCCGVIIIHAVWKLLRFSDFDFSWCFSLCCSHIIIHKVRNLQWFSDFDISRCCSPVLYSSDIIVHEVRNLQWFSDFDIS